MEVQVNRPIFDSRFCLNRSIVFRLREKILSLSGDSALIKDQSGGLWFQTKGKVPSFHERNRLYDDSGNFIAELEKKFFSLHSKVFFKDAEGNVLACLMKEHVVQLTTSNIKIYLFPSKCEKPPKNFEKQEPNLFVTGNFLSSRFTIIDEESNVVIEVGRDILAAQNILVGQGNQGRGQE
eukprot:TRINITY_DN564_c0_g2_i10.p1 TRINITY_DN564_c0_g2~~TRINITY_DN564_c0_g2_i10.p1  ORF type:complete len:180 (-),score=23.28 TRINITY_DN564_c0_g2_i10:289-828(-)